MSVRLLGLIDLPRLAALLLSGFMGGGFGTAHAQSQGRPIEFSEPSNTQVLSNFHQLTRKPDGFRQVEDDLFKPIESFSRGSLDGIPAPPMGSPTANPLIQNPRVRELLDRKRNWVFLSPDDFANTPTSESIFNLREFDATGNEKKKPSLLESFFERQQPNASSRPDIRGPAREFRDNQLNGIGRPGDSEDDSLPLADDSKLPSGLRQIQQDLKKQLMNTETASHRILDPSTPSGFSDLFGIGSQGTMHSLDRSKELNPQYHPFLGGPNAPGINSLAPFDPVTAVQRPAAAPAAVKLNPLLPPQTKPANAVADVVNPFLNGPRLEDVNSKALTQWNPMASPVPQVGPPKSAAPISIPDFPRRKGI
jgi:hypothetical protein